MIDPIIAITMATSAYNMVTRMVSAGREFEDTAQQLGKWFGAVSDLKRAEQQRKDPPLFRKLFASGSIEEESLAILMHNKKIIEQEKELKTLLMFRYGHLAWDELTALRRKIAKQREDTIYRQQELRDALLNTVIILILLALGTTILASGVWFIGDIKGWW